mgnify:CR=1 FL=1
MMNSSLFFCGVEENHQNNELIEMLRHYSEQESIQVYVLRTPLGNTEKCYEFNDAVVVLIPKHKICFINFDSEAEDQFEDFCDDFIEDLGYLSEKYNYRTHLGRPRIWKEKLIAKIQFSDIESIGDILTCAYLGSAIDQRNTDFLISLLIGSINDISRIGGDHPETLLDQVKKKIILFDGDQSRFIYSQPTAQKRITIQGLAGTGKTELLLHKLKDLYVKDKSTKIVFTCFNKILAQSMRKRVPEFFNFMKVEEQIEWDERLWVMPSWGSRGMPNTGVYSYICSKYDLEFHAYSYFWPFDTVCKAAIQDLAGREEVIPLFDYILIDESQDFPQSFFELCEKVTRQVVYIAGDIFQDIYDRTIDQSVQSDYLLNKCYRTDPKTLMFAHAVGMGLYEEPVIRWLDDDEWISCGYQISRDRGEFILSRAPLRRFEDLDMSGIRSIEVVGSQDEELKRHIYKIIDTIRETHQTVQAGDIAIAFLEGGLKENYTLADELSLEIPKRYLWKTIKGYETKTSSSDAVFISNRNNIKGLEFPFVICIVRGRITDNIFSRNTIYMMLTRSFITSYFLINEDNTDFIQKYQEAASAISSSGVLRLREPPEEEKRLQNQKIRIAVAKEQRPLREVIEEVFSEFPKLNPKTKSRVYESMVGFINDEGMLAEKEIQERTRKLISAYI